MHDLEIVRHLAVKLYIAIIKYFFHLKSVRETLWFVEVIFRNENLECIFHNCLLYILDLQTRVKI